MTKKAKKVKKQNTHSYKGFVKAFTISFAAIVLFLCGAIYIANPFNNMPLKALHTDQHYYDVEQRFFYPAIARQKAYDSAVFGTSIIRALVPEDLNKIFGGNFAQMAFNNGTAYEQYRLFKLFMKHHKPEDVKTVIVAIDAKWCERKDTYADTERSYAFPEYLYDENRWNDVPYLFNTKILEIIGRMINHGVRGKGRVRHMANGWGYMWPQRPWDLTQARKEIYKTEDGSVLPIPTQEPPFTASSEEMAQWPYATHALLDEMLNIMHDSTNRILIFPPYHKFHQRDETTENFANYQECKRRVTAIAEGQPNMLVIDFMIDSPITRNDNNYWDALHYNEDTTKRITSHIASIAENPLTPSDEYHVLYADWNGNIIGKEYP